MGSRRRAHLALRCALLAGLLLAGVGVAGQSPASARPERPAPIGSDPFWAGTAYSGDFPDPTVMRVGRTFYASSTTIAALNIPVTTSTDLRTWTPRRSSDPARPWLNDAMPSGAVWAKKQRTANGKVFWPTWAPSIARLGTRRFVAAYSVPRAGDGRRCISLARSASPLGPFTDRSRAPLTCLGGGAIDPQIFRDRGAVWLLYKVEGSPDRIMVRRMTGSAAGFSPASRNVVLMTPRAAWEGAVVENPAMIRFNSRLWLVYSGNGYGSHRYATGHAVCRSVSGPCRRQGRLLATGPHLAGPGGAAPFVDLAGRLRLAYHAWRTGNIGYPSNDGCVDTKKGCAQRRMYVAILGPGNGDTLVVRRKY